jgi:hypothetical protein
MYQTVGNVLRTLVHTNPLQIMTPPRNIVNDALVIAMHAMQTTVATLGSCIGSLAFSRDVFLNVPLIADSHGIHTITIIMLMRICVMPTRSIISMTMLWENEF